MVRLVTHGGPVKESSMVPSIRRVHFFLLYKRAKDLIMDLVCTPVKKAPQKNDIPTVKTQKNMQHTTAVVMHGGSAKT